MYFQLDSQHPWVMRQNRLLNKASCADNYCEKKLNTMHNSFLFCGGFVHVLMLVDLTLWFDPLSVSHQTVFEVCSSPDDSITADHTALDITPGKHTQITLISSHIF